jgi:uncharacterized coiled-coil DUF342 family protein
MGRNHRAKIRRESPTFPPPGESRDQREEREARIQEVLERARQHREQADRLREQADSLKENRKRR